MGIVLLVVALAVPTLLGAQSKNFVGVVGGISTLSADGSFSLQGNTSAQAQYKPENGPTVMIFGGRHLHDYFSVQVSYGWNRNSSLLTASVFGTTQSAYEQSRRNTQHTVVGEGMVYFRNLRSRVRPYLSAGGGLHTLSSASDGEQVIGDPILPPPRFRETGAAFRVAVGVDLPIRSNLAFRYSFAETIQGNPISKQLRPRGARNLANFQNLFGFSWQF